jgi:hypothetical protein
MVSVTSAAVDCSSSTPMASMNLLRKPIMTAASAIHSAFRSPWTAISSSRSAVVSSQGTDPSERATATVASSPRLNELCSRPE